MVVSIVRKCVYCFVLYPQPHLGTVLEMQASPPPPTCNPVQALDANGECNSPGSGSPYAPAEVTKGNEVDHESAETAESDMYRS